jgi:hypothetical protein
MLKKNKKAFICITLLSLILIPFLSFADGLVPCGNPGQNPCDFNFFIVMVNNIINWIIGIATSVFTISAIYGGFLYLTSGGSPGDKEKAKGILQNTVVGFLIILIAWLVVYTILTYLAPGNSSLLMFIKN